MSAHVKKYASSPRIRGSPPAPPAGAKPSAHSASTIMRGSLYKMVDAVIRGDRRVKWTHILNYMDSNTYADHGKGDKIVLPFESPLPAFCIATPELAKELAPCPHTGDSILRRCVLGGAPHRIVACLIQLAPLALKIEDSKGRTLLHLATRVPVSPQSEQILELLLVANPLSLLSRDTYGRTPLHWLLWYHCADRSAEIVLDFCQPLPKTNFYSIASPRAAVSDVIVQDRQFALPAIPRPQQNAATGGKVPHVAAIIPDAVFGCLPLHYAVANGASLGILQVLLQAYPLSKHVTDRYGRTAAHWYLGAGQVCFGPPHKLLHISGEAPNPHALPWFKTPLEPKKLAVVLSSRVARSMDSKGRNPLHWACFTLAHGIFHSNNGTTSKAVGLNEPDILHNRVMQEYMQVLQTLIDGHANQIMSRDEQNQTPFMVLLETYKMLQTQFAPELPPYHPVLGGCMDDGIVTSRIGLELTPALLKMLMLHPDKQTPGAEPATRGRNGKSRSSSVQKALNEVAALEDRQGRLPLHLAASIGCGIQTLTTLVQAHPTGLVHTTDTYQSPLHMAFTNPVVTPYWTSPTLQLFLKTYNTEAGVVVDGRMALKMEDVNGVYPIHYATQNNAAFRVLESLLHAYPAIAHLIRQDTEDLAFFHLIPKHLGPKPSMILQELLQPKEEPDEATKQQRKQALREALILTRQKMQLFVPLLLQESERNAGGRLLLKPDSRNAMHALHVAVLFQAYTYPQLSQLLQMVPRSAKHACQCLRPHPPTVDNPLLEFSILDLHEAVQPHWLGGDLEEWHHIRQLLFAYHPKVASHRHRQELLSQCVRVVIQEVNYRPKATPDEYRPDGDPTLSSSVHWHWSQKAAEEKVPCLEISHSLSATEQTLRQKLGIRRPPLPKSARPGSSKMIPKSNTATSTAKGKKKSTLASVREHLAEKKRRKSPRKSGEDGKSKYDDEDIGYDVTSDDEDSEDDSYSSDYSRGDEYDEDASYSDEDGSYTDTDGYTDREEKGASFTDDQYSDVDPQQTFSSDADSHGEWSPRSSESMDADRVTAPPGRRFFYDGKELPQAPPDAFDLVQRGILNMEEKKEEYEPETHDLSAQLNQLAMKNRLKDQQLVFAPRPAYLSEVGMRIWTFFALFGDVNNPNDNYVQQISSIFDEIPFSKVEHLVQLPLPECATDYLSLDVIFEGNGHELQTFRDAANPKCRELIHKTCFFVGTYEFSLAAPKGKSGNSGQDPGKSSAMYEPSLVFCRPEDGYSFAVRAIEWTFKTEEVTDAAVVPGLSEAEIWQTGIVPAETGATFRSRRRQVILTFIQDPVEFENEMKCRKAFPSDQDEVSVLLAYYDATKKERQVDKIYSTDIHDERFNMLSVGRGRVFSLQDYPYALVYEATETLDYVFSTYGGLNSTEEAKLVSSSVSTALRSLHSKQIVHGNICMRNVVRKPSKDGQNVSWTLRDFSYSCMSDKDILGKISPGGRPLFATGTLPPEMFVQLSAIELQAYERYWLAVEKIYGVTIDKSIIDPVTDPDTGDAYVVRCHYMPPGDGLVQAGLPPLPYELIVASPATDYWALGVLIFEICTGRPLFPTERRSGRLLDYHRHANWTNKVAASMIYSIVRDPIYQDLFLQLLSPISRRADLTVEKILSHPFFRNKDANTSNTIKAMIETRRRDTIAHKRMLQKKLLETSESTWLGERTTRLDCWDFSLLAKFRCAPVSIVRQMMTRKEEALTFPNSIVIIPYQLRPDGKGGLSPEIRDIAIATGARLLNLCKMCYLASELGKAVDFLSSEGMRRKLSMAELFNYVDVPREDFAVEMRKCSELASKHVESFRDDPRLIIQKVLKRALEKFVELFRDNRAYLYLVDEFNCVPVLEGCWIVSDDCRDEVVRRSVLSTVLTCICAWRTEGELVGFTKVLFQSSHQQPPVEWLQASKGFFEARFDDGTIISELLVLQEALSDMAQVRHSLGDHDLVYLREFMSKHDTKRRVGDLCRVLVSSDIGMWTTRRQMQRLEAQCQMFTLHDALEKYARH